ncbi:MAG: hypothetical protein EI684_18335 [Candidatus Viridilinea halotolerans]|uniref:Uncharacterized protein n=1 Tax=Candidatus Viridilinea halotolerans TaxID=2491704 RepID=A0A426TTF4_9CHLR|nr:MAG: hypothetical protein EI684_18335 [Candidatus Viridilinea halotolerans]
MTMNLARARKLLERSALAELFVEELGWDRYAAKLTVQCDGGAYTLHGIAQKRGMAVLTCTAPNGEAIPCRQQRNALEAHIAHMLHEHLIIFASADYADQLWQWVRKEPGRPITRREHRYHWHLDERPLRADNEINPDVLGYIFEKYINQKQMGAYYTKEDVTEYIGRSTIIPCPAI